ncbi:hypothetical protein ACIP98_20895 [Streptomyces sp. NPDC088354]|uniref:hypothetical protein n=1 Tax=Streptomyces sp. NPDC088354 TaxID=3365856 RepID=UPI00382F79F5
MNQRISLPSGAWVELRDPAELRRGDKKRALRMVEISEDGALTLGTQIEMADGVLAVLIAAWSYSLPLPVTAESLEMLPMEDGNALEEHELVKAAHKLLFPGAPEPTPEQLADPASPTEPSAE